MKNTLMESRVRSLEEMMADLIATVEQTSLEMREFKDGIREDTARFKDRTDAAVNGMREDTAHFKDRMDAAVDGMREDTARFKDETRQDHRDLNKQLGAIANKQGRMTEDLVAPSICRILQEVVDCPPNVGCGFLIRARRIHPKDRNRIKEFDVIAECLDYVLVNETKSKLAPTDIDELMKTIQDVREYFPEYRGRKFIGSLATLYADESLVQFASRKGIMILAVGDELMDVMNEPGFKPTVF